jgi:putative MATE family efflux protein
MRQKTESLAQQLYTMTWPMFIGMLAIMSCQLIDSAFIGQLGSQQLAVVGFSIPVYQIVIGVQVGLGIATTTVISMTLGQKNTKYASQLGFLVLLSGFFLVAIICLLIWSNQQIILSSLGASPNLFPLVREYWLPWLISCLIGAMVYFGCSIFRAHGDTFIPGMSMVLASILNIILDPILIFYLEMGISGAAWATSISFVVSGLIVFSLLIKRQRIELVYQWQIIKKALNNLLTYMAPSMLSQFTPPISAMIALTIVSSYGDIAVATWGLGSRLELLSIIIILSLTMAMPPMIGRFRGLKDFESIDKLVKIAVSFIIKLQLIIAFLLLITATPLANLLTTDQDIVKLLHEYLWIVPLSFSGLGVCMMMVSVCSAIGAPKLALVISIIRLFGCYIPLLWLGSLSFGLSGLFAGAAIANILAGIISWKMYRTHFNKLQHSQYG